MTVRSCLRQSPLDKLVYSASGVASVVVIHSSTAVLLRLLLSVVPRTLPLGTSALQVISRSATHRGSSLAENFVILSSTALSAGPLFHLQACQPVQ